MSGKTSTERGRERRERSGGVNDLPVDWFGPYPGYFTELVLLHDWPPGWEPVVEWGMSTVWVSEAATRGVEGRMAPEAEHRRALRVFKP